MPGEEENSGSSVGATAQPQMLQLTMFHQILPPQYLGTEDHRRNRRELEVEEREVQ